MEDHGDKTNYNWNILEYNGDLMVTQWDVSKGCTYITNKQPSELRLNQEETHTHIYIHIIYNIYIYIYIYLYLYLMMVICQN